MPDKTDKTTERIDFQVRVKKELGALRDKITAQIDKEANHLKPEDKTALADIADRLGKIALGVS